MENSQQHKNCNEILPQQHFLVACFSAVKNRPSNRSASSCVVLVLIFRSAGPRESLIKRYLIGSRMSNKGPTDQFSEGSIQHEYLYRTFASESFRVIANKKCMKYICQQKTKIRSLKFREQDCYRRNQGGIDQ